MGILTDGTGGHIKITKILAMYYKDICITLWVSAVIWFCLLACPLISGLTYFSENALLPGLVQSDFREEGAAKQYYDELQDEMKLYDDSIPYPWLLAKFQQIGLDTYTHNFTLQYPLGRKNMKYGGKNVYGIARAARAGSTEALVMTVPYRTPSSILPSTAPAIAVMLAFAKHANRQKYWAKDIIFLIVEHEQLGVQAWLEAYHDVVCGIPGVLDHGDLRGRGGAIQAAINLEIYDINLSKVNIKVEGLNGQLPNLDLFNLVARTCAKEGLIHSIENRENRIYRQPLKDWYYAFQTMLYMVFTQASGIPNGNHGLFHRFGIQALTLEGTANKLNKYSNVGSFLSTGRIIESIFRSLNNLLERFHQSFFFYLLPSSDRFVSIGIYIPAACLIAAAFFVKACGKWFSLFLCEHAPGETCAQSYEDQEKKVTPKTKKKKSVLIHLMCVFFFTHAVGVIIMNSPQIITSIGAQYGYNTETSLHLGFAVMFAFLLLFPMFVRFRRSYGAMTILHVVSLIEFGTALICLSIYNFSLGFVLGIIYGPMLILTEACQNRFLSAFQKINWIIVHPFIVVYRVVYIYTYISFPDETFKENLVRGVAATQQAIVFSIVDYMIYSNWLYVVYCVIIPNWLNTWLVLFSAPRHKTDSSMTKKKWLQRERN